MYVTPAAAGSCTSAAESSRAGRTEDRTAAESTAAEYTAAGEGIEEGSPVGKRTAAGLEERTEAGLAGRMEGWT